MPKRKIKAPLLFKRPFQHLASAETFRATCRRQGHSARLYPRSVRADGEEIFVWVVIVRGGPPAATP